MQRPHVGQGRVTVLGYLLFPAPHVGALISRWIDALSHLANRASYVRVLYHSVRHESTYENTNNSHTPYKCTFMHTF